MAAPKHSHLAHPDMLHMPDYATDPNGCDVVSGAQLLNAAATAWNIVVSTGATLTLGPACDLRVVTLFVDEGGTLIVQPGAKVTFRDVPFDFTFDGDQFGHGLIVFGKIQSVGTAKTSWARLAAVPKAGTNRVTLATPVVGWLPGDYVCFGDSRVFPTDDLLDWSGPSPRKKDDHTELRRVSSVSADGLTVTLGTALTHDHPGATDYSGQVRIMPVVSSHTRDIVWRSENAVGVRGHMMFTERADVNFQFNQIDDLGRTTAEPLDNTVWQGDTATHFGTNQVGKYAMHAHHLIGPIDGPVPNMTGNAVNNPVKWGISLHDTHWCTLADNIVYNAVGAGIVTETGQETRNAIRGNCVVHTTGSLLTLSEDDIVGFFGNRGDGYWFSGPDNHVTNNVAVDSRARGFIYILGVHSNQQLRGSNFPGADPRMPEEGFDCRPDHMEVRQFDGNESVSALNTGALFYNIAKIVPTTIDTFTAWHGWGSLRAANSDSLTIKHLTIIGGDPGQSTGRLDGIRLDQNHDFSLFDPYICGVKVGVSVLQPGYALLDDFVWLNIIGESPQQLGEIHANIGIGYERDTHNLVIGTQSRGIAKCRDLIVTAEPTGGSPVYTFYFWQGVMDGMDVTVPWMWLNTNVNGRDSEIFAPEQGPERQMPNTGTWKDPLTGFTWEDLKGASTPGLTTAQAFAQEGVAYGGKVATCASDPRVYGFECPRGDPPPPHELSVKITASPLTVDAGGVVGLHAAVVDSEADTCPWALRWSATAGTFENANAINTTWTAPMVAGPVVITATVQCADGPSSTDTVTIQVKAEPPVELHYTGVPTGKSTDGGVTITLNPPDQWKWTRE